MAAPVEWEALMDIRDEFGIVLLWVVLATVFPLTALCADVPEWDIPKQSSDTIVIPVSDEELMKYVTQALSAGGGLPQTIRKVELEEFGSVYVGITEGRQPVIARFVAQRVPCGDCHDVFFLCIVSITTGS